MKKKIPCTLFVCCVSFLGLRLYTTSYSLSPLLALHHFLCSYLKKYCVWKLIRCFCRSFQHLEQQQLFNKTKKKKKSVFFASFFLLAQRNNAMGMEWESFCLFPVVFTIFLTLSLFILGVFFPSISPFNGNHFVCFHCIHRWDRTIQFINTTRKYRAFN